MTLWQRKNLKIVELIIRVLQNFDLKIDLFYNKYVIIQK